MTRNNESHRVGRFILAFFQLDGYRLKCGPNGPARTRAGLFFLNPVMQRDDRVATPILDTAHGRDISLQQAWLAAAASLTMTETRT